MGKGTIYSICISSERGKGKREVQEAAVTEHGLENDGYAGEWGRDWGRQISCLNLSSVLNVNQEHNLEAGPGTFGENILVEGLDLSDMTVGDRLKMGLNVVLEVTQIGKEAQPGVVTGTLETTLLSSEGVFCKVIKGGKIKKGDPVEVI